MAYFSNSAAGMAFDSQCQKCKFGEEACPIALAQTVYNYDACGNDVATGILNALVKDDGSCEMYKLLDREAVADSPTPNNDPEKALYIREAVEAASERYDKKKAAEAEAARIAMLPEHEQIIARAIRNMDMGYVLEHEFVMRQSKPQAFHRAMGELWRAGVVEIYFDAYPYGELECITLDEVQEQIASWNEEGECAPSLNVNDVEIPLTSQGVELYIVMQYNPAKDWEDKLAEYEASKLTNKEI